MMAKVYPREIFSPGRAQMIRDMLSQRTFSPEPTYFDEDLARRQFLYQLSPDQVEPDPTAIEYNKQNKLRELLSPERRRSAYE